MRIQHCGLVNLAAVFDDGSFDGKQLRIDVGAVHCSQLFRQTADFHRMNAAGINIAGNFHARLRGQIFDVSVV